MREVEAQLVRAAPPSPAWRTCVPSRCPQRGVQQVGGGVVGRRSRGAPPVDVQRAPARPASARRSRPRRATAWSSPTRKTSLHAAAPESRLDGARVGDLAAALRVERALGELRQQAAVVALQRRRRWSARRSSRSRRTASGSPAARAKRDHARRGRPRSRARVAAPMRARSRCSSISSWKPSSSTDRPCSASSSARQVVGEAVGVVELERVLRARSTRSAPPSRARSARRAGRVPCSSVRPKLSSSASSHWWIVSRSARQLRVGAAHQLDHDVGEAAAGSGDSRPIERPCWIARRMIRRRM